MGSALVEIRDLTAGYPGIQVLKGINLRIPEGKVTALLGPNGCGKTTLLKAMCGILHAQSGQVLLQGENVLALPAQLRARKLAYLAQNRQVPDLTVERLVLHGRFPYLSYPRRYRQQDHAIAEAAMAQMGILEMAEAPMETLSGGQRQKAYIAMALAQDTPVILLDEPTTFLDIKHQLHLLHQAQSLAQQGKTILMILHDLAHAFRMADQLVLMDQGQIVQQGTPEQLFASGTVEQVFGVRLERTAGETGSHYHCESIVSKGEKV